MAEQYHDWLESLNIGPTGRLEKLNIMVIGAGGSGQTASLGFSLWGHSVTVIEKCEKSQLLEKDSGGLICSPNVSRLFRIDKEIEEHFNQTGTVCRGITYLNGATAEVVGQIPFRPDLMTELGGEVYFLTKETQLTINTSICDRLGAKFRWKTSVTSIDTSQVASGGPVHVAFDDGSSATADLVVAADGYHGTIRPLVISEDNKESIAVLSMANVSIPLERMQNNPELASLCDSDQLLVWMGRKTRVMGAKHGAQFYHLYFTSAHNHHGRTDVARTKEFTVDDFSTFNILEQEPRIRKLVELGSSAYFTTQHIANRDTIDPSNRVVIIGDACREIPILGILDMASGTEDAASLSCIFHYLTDRSQIPILLEAYRQIRQSRRATIQREMLELLELESLEPPACEERNAAFRLASGHESNEMLLRYVSQFNYDPLDAAYEWWVSWGRHMVEMNGPGASAVLK
ncbi:hypothetical protein C8J56DRAFT_1021985 [Mycena floridula]|nr:hypothetical protein C8J56DRAFT_1021985 [Mycena floridula]